MEGLVGIALGIGQAVLARFGGDLGIGPRLGICGIDWRGIRLHQGGLGVVDALGDPAGGEAIVVDATGVARGEHVIGGAQRGDRREVRRLGAGHLEL